MADFPTSPETATLKPCPFCGSPGAICCLEDEPGSPASFWVNCSCGIETPERRTEPEAIALWNRRFAFAQTPAAPDRERIASAICCPSGCSYLGDSEDGEKCYCDTSDFHGSGIEKKTDAVLAALSNTSTVGNSK